MRLIVVSRNEWETTDFKVSIVPSPFGLAPPRHLASFSRQQHFFVNLDKGIDTCSCPGYNVSRIPAI